MRDGGEMFRVVRARILREMDEKECRRRNALSRMEPGFRFSIGDEVSVLEIFGANEAFLVEAKADKRGCAWMGVLKPGEIEMPALGDNR